MTEYRIWPSTNGSGSTAGGFTDDLGVQFKVNQSGLTLNGYYFWVDATNNDVDHTKYSWRLYSTTNGTSGTLISNSTVSVASDFTPGQWNFQALPSPITLTSGTTYVASLHYSGTAANHYNHVLSYWSTGAGASGITNGPLTAPGSSTALGGNQCPENEPSASAAFPASSFSASNYWIDVSVNSAVVNASAGKASVTATAQGATVAIQPVAGAASITAAVPASFVGHQAGLASVTALAKTPSVDTSLSTNARAGLAAATAVVKATAMQYAPAGQPAVTVTGQSPAVSTTGNPGLVQDIARAFGVKMGLGAAPGNAGATATARTPAAGVGAPADVAPGAIAAAYQPSFFFLSSRVIKVPREIRTFQIPLETRTIRIGTTT